MKIAVFLAAVIATHSFPAQAKEPCSCKCVVKEEDGSLVPEYGKGKNREAAGEDLKKNLKKRKCELSPTCSGGCNL